MNKRIIGRWIIGLVLGFGGLAQARTIYVDIASSTSTSPYTNGWSSAAHTIQSALDVAVDGDEVILAAGTYTPSATLVVTNDIYIRGLILTLESAPCFVIDGQNTHRVFDLGTNAVQLIGLTIQNGTTSGNGGGISCADNTPFVWNCIISGNENGGGMYKGSANGCIFTNNASSYGGGANLTEVEYCLFVDNSATTDGGGLYNSSADRCTFRNNSAKNGAGMNGGTARRCTFVNNIATGDGGGASSSTLNQCALTANSAGDEGGGCYSSTANNCTFSANTAFNAGGGMSGGTANNSILWDNQATVQDNNLTGDTETHYSCYPEAQTDDGLHNINTNPQRVSFSHISTNSPCIGTGSTNYLTHVTDFDGDAWNATPSIGCDEIKTTVEGEMTPILFASERVAETEEIHFTAYVEGEVTQTVLDFGDGIAVTNPISSTLSHPFTYGDYWVVLTGYNDDYPNGVSVSNRVSSLHDTTTTIYVSDTDGSNLNDGESWATAKQTIQAGIEAQDVAGGLVLVSNGTYTVDSDIFVNKEIRIESFSGAAETILEGNGQYHLFNLANRHCSLEGFTFSNTGGYGGGSAVYCESPDPVVGNCIFLNNGGGAMLRGTANQCTFSNNSGQNGPALRDGIANNCTFSNNSGNNGPGAMQGGIATDCLFENNHGLGGSAGGGAMGGGIATRCIFKDNTNVNAGGAMSGSTATDCQFIGNVSDNSGGGAYNSTVYNCVFNGNKTKTTGGGISGGSATHCTFTANRAINYGGTYSTTLDHCIVWYNEALQSYDNTAYATATSSCSPDLEHGVNGNITNNPQFVSASHIALTSPCAGSGTILRDTLDIDGEHWRTSPAIGCDEPADPPIGAVAITLNGPTEIPAGFDAFYTVDFQGAFERDEIDFDDGFVATGSGVIPFSHSWSKNGTYDLVVTAWNNNHQDSYSITNQITVYAADFNSIYVRTDGDDSNNGRSWFNAKQTIQAAIDEQELTGGQVIVSNGVYTLTSTILIDKEIQLIGFNGAESTWIDAIDLNGLDYQHSRAMEIGDNHSTVSGLTVRNANYSWTGGGIFCDYSDTPVISNCILTNNSAGKAGGMCYGTAIDCRFFNNNAPGFGGGLYLANATDCQFVGNYSRDGGAGMYRGTATDCTFSENTGGYGSGMRDGTASGCTFENNNASYGGGTHGCRVTDSLFSGNSANQGGGMHGGSATDCTFVDNSAETSGGGLFQTIATRCVVSGNRAENGGGMSNGEAYSCSISGNKAYNTGGGTYSTVLYNCTVTGNTASDAGGVYGQTQNCIVWGNTASDGMNDINDNNIYLNYIKNTCSPDAPHGTDGCITNNPLLISSMALSTGSPCIGKGDAATATGTDLNGDAWGTPPAMGCDEVTATLTGSITMSLIGPSPIRTYVEGSYIALFEGQVTKTVVDFGDGQPLTNAVGLLSHTWTGSQTQDAEVVLTGFNDSYPLGVSTTQIVAVVNTADSDIHVKQSGNDQSDGASWSTAKRTIQAGIDTQNIYGGRVLIDADIYAITEPILVDTPIVITSGSDGIDGAVTSPVIDGGGSSRCFNLGYSECVLENLVIRNGAVSTSGSGDYKGGGVYCQNGAPRITYSTLEGCVAYYGAGVYKGTLENCNLSNNVASFQGGAAYGSTLSESTICSNSAQYGGGISSCEVNDCILSNNTATTIGGGAYSSTVTFSAVTHNAAPSGGGLADCTTDRCDISGNMATSGYGGGLNQGTVHNSTIHHNLATQSGGGTYNTTLYNCTVVENKAKTGGGVYGYSLYNTIVWSNLVFIAGSDINIASASPKNSCYPEADHGGYYGNITNAPLFVALAPDWLIRGGDYYLSNLSPCINAGDNQYVSTDTDYNGLDRIRYGTVDMGACEMWLIGDSDDDGMGDSWELENYGGVTNAVASDDSDHDAFDNRSEYIAGTDPHDDTTYLRIVQSEMIPDSEDPNLTLIYLEWAPSVEGRIYGISSSTNLVEGFHDTGNVLPYPHDNHTIGNTYPNAYYKINVRLDD